ncbi:TrkA family potassium uptake protein [Streptomyces sp. NEAU-H3]|uniref:potassium channel family protein n=1 Tax=Streptomyces sp. NEAU-H3 TaxID=2720636 RepID=UPI00143B7ECC|nr:potassium channel family protein [Streptomyces sp. NEAU-H3]NJA59520.1 potassium channel protein [Streptomyces sp. NEAU-H3]
MHVKLPGQDAIARQAGEQLVATRIKLPRRVVERPFRQVAKRIAMALAVLVGTALLVYAGRDGYGDNSDHKVDLLDAFYYATVTLSTTGYGDIVPVSDTARLINILVVTPLRVLFLIILVGTTLEVLTERTREEWRLHRWRHALRDHTVVVGFGTKGRSAIKTVLAAGSLTPQQVVVVDPSEKVIELATVALTARQLNRAAHIVAAVREEENAPLLRQSGADAVITSASAAGRLLGLSVLSPSAGTVMEDLIQQGTGLDLVERPVIKAEIGRGPRETDDLVVSVVRGHRVLGYDDPAVGTLQATARLITIVRAGPDPRTLRDTRPLRGHPS